ncbi:hypothetical protein ASPZODRAFT_92664 [Penicilliopsis zonata CBS 506.65]|uniref:DUF3431 domain-containing protein n=1 Tax=Penicilliopsis zonata CBS 506.65 TaxID=1073090 RepID=A0A1L9SM30_9EURO|nr:hypothetical protein ASPZODRAFT_92664 [Penicilliopsis zonata CBS 506.65]OJJ48248.1 hypothetical protein ASPZODRAFT_92664 [Penicilliopsis zonata CBS 506.65]
MRLGLRLLQCLLPTLVVVYLLKCHVLDLEDQYRAGVYFFAWLKNHRSHEYKGLVAPHAQPGDKIIVMAKLEAEWTDWVEEELPDWQRAIYVVNPSRNTLADTSTLTTPLNKGHESMAYLTYIIDHYDSLPSTVAFLHPHRAGFFMAWHTDEPLHDNVEAMRSLRLGYVQRNGYVNLRCNWNPGCKPDHRYNRHVTEQVWREIFEGTSTPPNITDTQSSQSSLTPTDATAAAAAQSVLSIPDQIGAACCAQFVVSRNQIRKRPRSDYLQFRQWVVDTNKTDAISGRVMEFLWHVIFGKDSVYCPDEQVCYCQVYGHC